MKFDKDFKIAISNLPTKEKDKLLLRLLKKDMTLAKRLYFELVNPDTVEQCRADLEVRIIKMVQQITIRYYSPGILMMEMREVSGAITYHTAITKDKYGEISLNLLLLNEILKLNISNIEKAGPSTVNKLCVYIIAKTFKILMLRDSLHQDYYIDFSEAMLLLGNQISKSDYLMRAAIQNGLDVNWLLSDDIPSNIKDIYKDIRAQGFLR